MAHLSTAHGLTLKVLAELSSYLEAWRLGVLFQPRTVPGSCRTKVRAFFLAAQGYSQLLETTTLSSLPFVPLHLPSQHQRIPLVSNPSHISNLFHQEEPCPFYSLMDEIRLGQL